MVFEPFFERFRGIQNKITENHINSPTKEQIAYIRQLQREMKQRNFLSIDLEQLHVVVFDIETTGFYPSQGDEVISIGAIKIMNGQIQQSDSFYSLVRSQKNIPPEIEMLTGIKNEELINAPTLSDVVPRFFQYVQHLPLVAHHSKHEKAFFQHIYWRLYRSPFNHRLIDTSFLYQIVESDMSLVRLEDLCLYNDIPVVNRHHALGDAILAAQLWCTYIGKLKERGIHTLQEVYEKNAILTKK